MLASAFKKLAKGFSCSGRTHHSPRRHYIFCLNGSKLQQIRDDFGFLFFEHAILRPDVGHSYEVAATEGACYVLIFELPSNQLAKPHQRPQQSDDHIQRSCGNGR